MKLDEIAPQKRNAIMEFQVEGDHPQGDDTETLDVYVWSMGPELEDTEFSVYNQQGQEVDPDDYDQLSTDQILQMIKIEAQKQSQRPDDYGLDDRGKPGLYDEPRIADPNDRRR